MDQIVLPAHLIPAWNTQQAIKSGVDKRFLLYVWGGLGDRICAEPAIRFMLNNFKDTKFTLLCDTPELFSHLHFHNVYRDKASIKEEDYFICNSIVGPDHLLWQYCSHMQCHPVDFASMCMMRAQLPVEHKEIRLPNFSRDAGVVHGMFLVHPGKHWGSKTFPAAWWASVLEELVKVGLSPVIVGKHVDENVGYVDFEAPEGCLDMRDKLSLSQFLGCAKYAKYVLSNDSAIIHAAAAGDAHIGIVASVKHPDYLKHWRRGQFGYKTTVFGNDGVWNHVSWNPVQPLEVNVMNLPDGLTWDKILPEPAYIASCVKDS